MEHFKFNSNKSIDFKDNTHNTNSSFGIFNSTDNTLINNSKNIRLSLSIKKNEDKKIPLFSYKINVTPIRQKAKIRDYIRLTYSNKKVLLKTKPVGFSPKYSILKAKIKPYNTLNGYVGTNNLFTLPTIYKSPKINNSPIKKCFSVKKNKNKELNCKNIFSRNNIKTGIEYKDKKLTDGLKTFMKSKYYEDVEDRVNKKLNGNCFLDTSSHDKIVELNKIGVFWNNVCDFCNPIIYAQKYRCQRKNIKSLNDQEY